MLMESSKLRGSLAIAEGEETRLKEAARLQGSLAKAKGEAAKQKEDATKLQDRLPKQRARQAMGGGD